MAYCGGESGKLVFPRFSELMTERDFRAFEPPGSMERTLEMPDKDEMLQIDLYDGQVRVMLCETTQTVQRCV